MKDPLLQEYLNRGVTESTMKRDNSCLQRYLKYIQSLTENPELTLTDLIEQAEDDIDNIPRERKRRIGTYLKTYHTYLNNSGFTLNTVKREFVTVKGFYKYHDITPPDIKKKFTIDPIHETIDDIPKKEHIIRAINVATLKTKAMILLMATSGMDASTFSNIKVKDLIKGIEDYIDYDITNFDLKDFIQTCKKEDNGNIIPYWTNVRKKTKRFQLEYFTFCTPETFTAIIEYLDVPSYGARKPKTVNDYLFPGDKGTMTPSNVQNSFKHINDGFGWPKHENGIRFFHSHAMRKFFANVLEDNEVGGRSFDHMMGHSPGKVKKAYVKPKKERLLVQYKKCLEDLTMEKIVIHDMTPAQVKQIVKENVEIRENQEDIAQQFTKILEFAKTDPEGFIKHMKKAEK